MNGRRFMCTKCLIDMMIYTTKADLNSILFYANALKLQKAVFFKIYFTDIVDISFINQLNLYLFVNTKIIFSTFCPLVIFPYVYLW